jgi:hypothetical protein
MIDTVVTCYVKIFLNNSVPWQHIMLKVADPPPPPFSSKFACLDNACLDKFCWRSLVPQKTSMPWQLVRLEVALTLNLHDLTKCYRLKVAYPRWTCRWLCWTKNERKPSKKRIICSSYSGFNETRSERRNSFHFHHPHFPISRTRGWLLLFLT